MGVRCSYKGVEGHRVVYIWVDKDFSLTRGWFMGFPKKSATVHMVQTVSSNTKFGELWRGKGELEYYPSMFEEHTALAPKEILGAFLLENQLRTTSA